MVYHPQPGGVGKETVRVIFLLSETTMKIPADTIVACATARGPAAIAVIRISGSNSIAIGKAISKEDNLAVPRQASYRSFYDAAGNLLDQGLLIYFPQPHSFTGEDVLELQVHGSEQVVDALLDRITELGARAARPGEFSERAFLNEKIDLAQAESIQSLIQAHSRTAARAAARSLQGGFSVKILSLRNHLLNAQANCEAALDFPEEDIQPQSLEVLQQSIHVVTTELQEILQRAKNGLQLSRKLCAVIAGAPNAGKSSLFNLLNGQERAIVSDIAGTTRDILREKISLDGIQLELVDTAGLHHSENTIEQEGMRRTRDLLAAADIVIWVHDGNDRESFRELPITDEQTILLIHNKIDLLGMTSGWKKREDKQEELALSARTGDGILLLQRRLRQSITIDTSAEEAFIARKRHIDALLFCQQELLSTRQYLQQDYGLEFIAEHLRSAQQKLDEITGKVVSDDVLGEIFANFCIGK